MTTKTSEKEIIGLIAYAVAKQEPTIQLSVGDNSLTLKNGPDQFLVTVTKIPEAVL